MIADPCLADAAWEDVRLLLPKLGVTRLADVTGLDRVGLPVAQAIRPLSKSNSVSQGKGRSLLAAARSAVMESAESFFAEQIDRFPVTVATARSLGVTPELYDLHVDPEVLRAWTGWETAWTPAKNLCGGTSAFVPLELVHTAYVVPPPDYDGLFHTSTTGLAAAFSMEVATRHGLLECIERDAVARALQVHGVLQDRRFDPARLQSPDLDAIVADLREKGFLVGLWLLPAAGHCPVVWCHLMEDCDAAEAVLPRPAEGSAARLSVADAAIAAILEAAQSRLTVIAGARDDIGQEGYQVIHDQTLREAHRMLLKEGRSTVPAEDAPDRVGRSATEDVECLLTLLQDDGISDVFSVQLDTQALPQLHVVKVLVPRLQPLQDG